MLPRFLSSVLIVAVASSWGCAKGVPVYDEAGAPIPEHEIRRQKGSSNLVLYAVGGGALSFGVSFFVGSLASRASDDDKSVLWGTTLAGATVGTVLFAYLGANRDRTVAIETIKDRRRQNAARELEKERLRRAQIEAQKRALEEERKRQEQERQRLLEEIRKKQSKEKKP